MAIPHPVFCHPTALPRRIRTCITRPSAKLPAYDSMRDDEMTTKKRPEKILCFADPAKFRLIIWGSPAITHTVGTICEPFPQKLAMGPPVFFHFSSKLWLFLFYLFCFAGAVACKSHGLFCVPTLERIMTPPLGTGRIRRMTKRPYRW